MAEIVAAVDEAGATAVLQAAVGGLVLPPQSGSTQIGPFNLSYVATASLSGGNVDLVVPDTIRVTDMRLDYSVTVTVLFDLSDLIGDFCLPQVCVPVPCDGELCTPTICVNWPTIPVPVPTFSDFVNFDAEFTLNPHLSGSDWVVDLVLKSIPFLQLGPAGVLLMGAVTAAVSLAMLAVPFIGPFLALATTIAGGILTAAAATGLLGPLITPFVSGMSFELYRQPQLFEVLPATSAIDPAVTVTIDDVRADVQNLGAEDELVLAIDITG